MWIDEIVEEIRRIREAHAEKFNYDLDAIYQDLKKNEARSNQKYVSFPPKPPVPFSLMKSAKKTDA